MTFLKHFPSQLGTPRDQQVQAIEGLEDTELRVD